MGIRIERVLNNNAVVSTDSDGHEIVVIRNGIAFRKKYGGFIAESKIQQIFRLQGQQNQDKFSELLGKIPPKNFEIAQSLIDLAREGYGIELNDSVLITVADHIAGAVQRSKNGINLSNELKGDIKKIYSKEYEIGQYVVRLINQNFQTQFGSDEAAFIAMHILDGRKNVENKQSLNKVIKLIEEIQDILVNFFHRNLDKKSMEYSRLITHLEFFTQRILSGEKRQKTNDVLWKMLSKTYPNSYNSVQKVAGFLKDNYDYKMSKTDQMYLIIHVASLFEKG
ncbi:PRD domain-containing protein [Pediococcus siamensis]|uniref:PRD domain-containing protein n=1 Tax=Pediococcus siamensis TaxID=381829 RepID=UPI0039A2D9A2